MDDKIQIKDLNLGTPTDTSWLVFQDSDTDVVYKAPKSDIEGHDAYVYIAYADDASGSGFTNTFNASKNYIAILSTDTEIPSPVVGDFAGLWKKYKGETGEKGDAATIQVGTVTTIDPGDSATVVNSGDEHTAVFNFEIPQGEKGKGIVSIDKTGTVGLIDTYTITYNDSTTTTFDVTNGDKGNTGDTGRGIVSIEKTNTVGLVDTYTITYTDNTTSTFDVTNGAKGDKGDKGDIGPQGIQGIQGIQGNPGTNGIDGINGISFTPKGAYDALTEYVANDVVSYLGSSWIALQTTTGNTPEEGAYWTLNAEKGTDGIGSGDVMGPATNTDNYIPQWDGTDSKTLKNGLALGIADDNIVQIDMIGVADNDYAKFTANGLEGRSYSEVLSDIGAEPADATILKDADIGSTIQAYDAGLTDIAGLAVADGNIIVGNGTNWVAESGSTARSSLGLGSLATLSAVDADSVTVSNLEVDNLKAGVLDTDLSSVSGSDDTIPSAKATKAALDAKAPTASPTFTGTVTLADNARIDLTLPTADTYVTGNTTDSFSSGYSSAVGDLVFFGSGGKWLEVDADAVATCQGLIGIALEAKTDTQAMKVALPGSFVRLDAWNWTVGATLYAGETLGAMQETIPTGADAIIKVVGFAVSADVIYFNPSSDQQSTVA